MFAIQGLDKLQDELADLQQFMNELDGELGVVSFDSEDAKSIDEAVEDMEKMVDNKVLKYSSNATVMNMVNEIKANLRQQIIGKADVYNIEKNKE